MYSYHFAQWLLFFYFYCSIGWVIESTIVSVSRRRLTNRGFLRGPYLPLYGSGALVILLIALPLQNNPVAVFFGGMAGATVLEYITGWAMESLFRVKYWDYSKNKCNLHGRICLKSSLFWGVLSVALVEWIHPPLERLVLGWDLSWIAAADVFISCLVAVDAVYAVRAALDLSKLLEKMTKLQAESERLRGELAQRVERDTAALRSKLESLRSERAVLTERLGFLKTQLIQAHPSARSRRFDGALAEVRQILEERRRSRKKK